MKNHMRCYATLAAFALLGSSTAAADTHLRQPASDSVTLEAVGTSPVCPLNFFALSFKRNMPDGNSVFPFVIPTHKVLVVTDMDWQWNSGTPGRRQILRLSVVNTS
jgi:hypothetical protein